MKSLLKFLSINILLFCSLNTYAFDVTNMEDSLGCGTTHLDLRTDCNFSGTIGIEIIGDNSGIIITNISNVSNGSFSFDITIEPTALQNAIFKFTILTTAPGTPCIVGDSAEESVVLTCACTLDIQISTSDETCFQCNNGSVSIDVEGGTAPYSYEWNNGINTPETSNLSPGNYSVTITDGNGCNFISNFSILPYNCIPFDVFSNASNVTCTGACDGMIEIQGLSNGSTDYSVNWIDGSNEKIRANLCPGVYVAEIINVDNCSTDLTFIINSADPLNLTLVNVEDADASGNGSIEVASSDTLLPHNYILEQNGIQIQTSATGFFGSLSEGCYSVILINNAGCIASLDSICVQGEILNSEKLNTEFKMFPNPADDFVKIINESGFEPTSIIVRDMTGKIIISSKYSERISTELLRNGIYSITISDGKVNKSLLLNIIH